jgi:hypothetical protein
MANKAIQRQVPQVNQGKKEIIYLSLHASHTVGANSTMLLHNDWRPTPDY